MLSRSPSGTTRTVMLGLSCCMMLALLIVSLSPGVSPVTRTARAATACPADQSHLVPWRDGHWFLAGMNVPWLNGGFGADFGTVEEWWQHTYTTESADQMFAALKARGVNSVRWWVFADGRGAPEIANGMTTGFDANTLPSMADAIKLAAKHDIYIVFTLWSFDMLARPNGIIQNRRDLVVDTTKRQAFIDNAVIPMLRYPIAGTSYTIGTHPNVITWEIINEPEWGVRESGSIHWNIDNPVSRAEMQRFIAEVTGAIRRNSNQLITVGAAAMKWNSDTIPGAEGNWYSDAALTPYDADGYLDYYQIHYYPWANGDNNWTFSPMRLSWQQGGFDKPVVIGEFPANADGSGMTPLQLLESIYNNCYAGAMGWTYEGVDSSGSWQDIADPMGTFTAARASTIRITPPSSGGTPTPTVQPTVQPTAQPTVQPTAQPTVQPTAQPTVQPTAQPTTPPEPSATLTINYPDGAPDSYFLLTGTSFPAGHTIRLQINGELLSETIIVGDEGQFRVLLKTVADALPGPYLVTVTSVATPTSLV
ncbi:MAG: hypothetical protein EOM24_15205, partial [Chloroflexia bacterium]|nr:hypothetical protein [Chloroflexia bacterium]